MDFRSQFANGLSGKLQSGDIVSVIAPDYKGQGETVIPPELKYVEVISVTASSGDDANTGESTSEDEKELPSTVTLLVTPEQGNLLATLEADGKCHLSLVYRGESVNTTKFLDMQSEILKELYPDESVTTDGEETDLQDEIPGTEDQTLDTETGISLDAPDSQKPDSGEELDDQL